MRCFHRLRQVAQTRLPTCRASFSTRNKPDVIVVGAGHNGLVAATLLARQGLQVSLLIAVSYHAAVLKKLLSSTDSVVDRASEVQVEVHEAKDKVGGACKTEYPFQNAPGLGTSTGEA